MVSLLTPHHLKTDPTTRLFLEKILHPWKSPRLKSWQHHWPSKRVRTKKNQKKIMSQIPVKTQWNLQTIMILMTQMLKSTADSKIRNEVKRLSANCFRTGDQGNQRQIRLPYV